jgi:hypothetical protein
LTAPVVESTEMRNQSCEELPENAANTKGDTALSR